MLAVTISPWFWLLAGFPAVFLVWSIVLVPRQVRAIGYAERDDDLLIRKGVMFRSMVVVPYGRMQYVDVEAGPLDRKLGPGEGAAPHGVRRHGRPDPRPAPGRGGAPARPPCVPW